MIIRLTAKLGKKIHIQPENCLPLADDPLTDWSARLFTVKRVQYILFTNTACLYSIVFPGKGVADQPRFVNRSMTQLREFMRADGFAALYLKRIGHASGEVEFSKAMNRTVTGSMNDMVQSAEYQMREQALHLGEVATVLNEMPMSYLKYSIPRKELIGLAGDDL